MRRFLWIPIIVLATLALAWLDAKDGVSAWHGVRGELARSRVRIGELAADVTRLEHEADALRDDPVAIESAIRQDLGLARPGEIVIRLFVREPE